MSVPLVSVLMITYNHEEYIARAIEGVLAQRTDFPFELIIGEDCSTDSTGKIAREYAQRFPDVIKLIASTQNVGGHENSHRTQRAARGKYFAWCEGDDYWHDPRKLAIQADFLERNPDYGYVFSDYDVLHVKDGTRIESFLRHTNYPVVEQRTVADFALDRHGVLTCTVMMRADLCRKIKERDPYLHDGKHFLMGDTQVWAEASAIMKSKYFPESLATHIISPESATRSADVKKRIRFSISNAEMILYLCQKYGLDEELKAKFEDELNSSRLAYAFHSNDSALATVAFQSKLKISLRDRLFKLGAERRWVYRLFRILVGLASPFRRSDAQWR